MNINLFKLGLERLEPSDWEEFERLASAFLAVEFPDLRTMAHPSGDGGRDSELFSSHGNPIVAFQYSVQKNWRQKINETAKRLIKDFPDIQILIFLSNQQIGGQSDDVKRSLLEKGLALDVRDRNWFLERAELGEERQNGAERLIDRIARPYLSGEQVINKSSSALTSQEARAALLYLGLQWKDDITEKGLTKLSFDALARAALRHTHSDNRMARAQVHRTIQTFLPSANEEHLKQHVDAALKRLTKRYIRHWQKEDEFCLTYEEHQRMFSKLAEKENEEAAFNIEIAGFCKECLAGLKEANEEDLVDLQTRVPRVVEKLLLRRGEVFVSAVITGKLEHIGFEDLIDIVSQDLSSNRPQGKITHHMPNIIGTIVHDLLVQPKEATQFYLRRLANSYTLFSFLRETPDVQTATRKLFSHATVWLDTTVLLPLFAEQLYENEVQRKFSRLLLLSLDASIEFCVTPGIIQEINGHMNRALACSQYSPAEWRGFVPYLYQHYLQTGNPRENFRKWLSLFRGVQRPEDDIAQYLFDVFGIKKVGLLEQMETVDPDLKGAAQRLWSEAHRERRRQNEDSDEDTTLMLINNDLETYLGVIALRSGEQVTELGFRHWLLTLDSIAWQIRNRLREEFQGRTPQSPLLSLDFLVNSLTFGPERRHLSRSQEQTLPIVLDVEMSESMPQDILELADDVRRENVGLPEYVIRRKVRDAIDRARKGRSCSGARRLFEIQIN